MSARWEQGREIKELRAVITKGVAFAFGMVGALAVALVLLIGYAIYDEGYGAGYDSGRQTCQQGR